MALSQPSEPNAAEALANIPSEPLLPVEKKLIGVSLALGLLLLGLLWWISSAYYSVP